MGLFKKKSANYFEGDRVEYADQHTGKWRRGTIQSLEAIPTTDIISMVINFDDNPGGESVFITSQQGDRIRKVG